MSDTLWFAAVRHCNLLGIN